MLFIVWIILPLIGGILSAMASAHRMKTWYKAISKPVWAPPNYIFVPIWSVVYLMIGVASYLIDRDGQEFPRTLALIFYSIQVILHWIWLPTFFVFNQLGAGIFLILFLFIDVFICVLQFWNINSYAGMLMIPCLIWVAFVAVLNIAMWRLNSPYAQPPPRRPRPRLDLNQD